MKPGSGGTPASDSIAAAMPSAAYGRRWNSPLNDCNWS